jgi:hypothetical protein
MRILNVGGGDRPLSKRDLSLNNGFVINYDPGVQVDQIDQHAFRQLGEGAIFFNYFEAGVALPDVVYFSRMVDLNAYFGELSFDLILAISPYAFHAVSENTNALLAVNGRALVIGNSRNPWLDVRFTPDDVPGVFAPGLIQGYSPHAIPEDPADPLRLIAERIQREYISYTTAQVQGGGAVLRRTELDAVKAFRKI